MQALTEIRSGSHHSHDHTCHRLLKSKLLEIFDGAHHGHVHLPHVLRVYVLTPLTTKLSSLHYSVKLFPSSQPREPASLMTIISEEIEKANIPRVWRLEPTDTKDHRAVQCSAR